MRRLVPLVALVLLAPSCPREYGPADYDPDARRSLAAHGPADLVYVQANSAKGDSMFVVAMPEGRVLARIDGPDRRGWALFADGARAFYPVTHARDGVAIYRIDLASGAVARIVENFASGPSSTYGVRDAPLATLATTADASVVIAVRAVAGSTPSVQLASFDGRDGALRQQRSWTIDGDGARAGLAALGRDRFATTRVTLRQGRVAHQALDIVDRDLSTIASFATDAGLPGRLACGVEFRRVPAGWATLCEWFNERDGAVVILDDELHVSSITSFPMGPDEAVLAWTASAAGITLVTDREHIVRFDATGRRTAVVRIDGEGAPRSQLGPAAALLDEGSALVSRFFVPTDRSVRPPPAEMIVVDLGTASSRVLPLVERPLALRATAREVYAIFPDRLRVLDRTTLSPMAPDVMLRYDEIVMSGLAAVVRSP